MGVPVFDSCQDAPEENPALANVEEDVEALFEVQGLGSRVVSGAFSWFHRSSGECKLCSSRTLDIRIAAWNP